jgi:hypothetical protein
MCLNAFSMFSKYYNDLDKSLNGLVHFDIDCGPWNTQTTVVPWQLKFLS